MLLVPHHHLTAVVFSALCLGSSASADALGSVSEVHILMILLISSSTIVGTRTHPNLLLLILIIVRGGFFVEALVSLMQGMRDPTAPL